jgi:beta-glucosidase
VSVTLVLSPVWASRPSVCRIHLWVSDSVSDEHPIEWSLQCTDWTVGDFVSAFSAGVTVAATWDRSLAYTRGYDMGSEHRDKGVDVMLGPVVGPLGRSPEGGRNWEGFSPDPVLSGILNAETVMGIQDAGVIACTKHYILNEQEHFRQGGPNISDAVSANVDDITLHELYVWPFADAVRAGTGSVMCSYNQANNSYVVSTRSKLTR